MPDIHEVPIMSNVGGLANLAAISDEQLAVLTPERRKLFDVLRAAQTDAKAAEEEAVGARRNITECETLRDQMIREHNKFYPPQDRIAALREVQQATSRRSR